LFGLLPRIAQGFDVHRTEFVVFCPVWIAKEVREEIADFPAEIGKIFSVLSCVQPFSVLSLYRARQLRRREASARGSRIHQLIKILRRAWRDVGRRVTILLRNALFDATALQVVAPAIFLALLGLLALALALPTILVALPAMIAALLIVFACGSSLWSTLRTHWVARSLRAPVHWLARPIRFVVRSLIQILSTSKDAFQQREFRRMALAANRAANVDVWFVLHPTHESAAFLARPVVSLFADFVPIECPSGFPEHDTRRWRAQVRRVIARANALITFSQHVRDHHVLSGFPQASRRPIYVIRHAMIDYPAELPNAASNPVVKPNGVDASDLTKSDAARLINAYIDEQRGRQQTGKVYSTAIDAFLLEYMHGLPWDHIPYVVCSTQNRPYKNIFCLVRAIEWLVRRRYVDIKLVLTAQLYYGLEDDALAEYIRRNRLHLDVLSLPRVPRTVHASLYKCAALTVHPSFFEGALPWAFSESVSMGTPVLLSRTPTTLESLGEDQLAPFLFDPYSERDLATKIEWMLANRREHLARQTEVFRAAMAQYTWRETGAKYAEVFERVALRRDPDGLPGLPVTGRRLAGTASISR
jgi:glycosyltransferase involved in cell wall biosynthesis